MVFIIKVFLVTGGRHWTTRNIFLDSTEILEINTWRMSAPLPSGRFGLRAASLGNTIYLFGRKNFCITQLYKYDFVKADMTDILI